MSDDTSVDEAVEMFSYFWREKGDPERWIGYEENKALLVRHHPELIGAWEMYKGARLFLNRLTE